MVFFKIAAKNLGRVKSRTFLTVLAIALGTALLTGITILNDSYLDSYLNGVSEQLGYTDIGVKRHLNVSDGFFDPDDFLDDTEFKDIEGYKDYTGRIVGEHIATEALDVSEELAYETTFFGIDVKDDIGYGNAEILDVIDEIDDPETIEDILEEDSSYCVITSWVEEVYDFQLEDQLYIPHATNPNVDYDNSSTWDVYTVAGIINDKAEGWDINYDYSEDEVNRRKISRAIYVDISQARDMFNVTDSKEINLLYIHVELDKLDSFGKELLEILSEDGDYEYFGENIKAGELETVYDQVRTMQVILIVFTMISFIVAAMLTVNTLMMSVNEQKYEVGVMRAQGIYKEEIFKMFLFEGLLLALAGSVCGVLMGMGLSPLLRDFFFKTMMSDLDFELTLTYNPSSILIVFAITTSISLLIGILPAYLATKIEIIEAIRGVSSKEKEKKYKKLIFPLVGLILTLSGYLILLRSHRDLIGTLVGIIPFILGLIILSTILIPLLSKGFSFLFSFFLGPYRKITDKNLSREPKQTKITFIMFGLAIGFLVMISNVLHSIEIIQHQAVPRALGADIILSSEGSTFGMDEILVQDKDIIDGAVEKAALLNGIRCKVDEYGTWVSEKADEPRVTMYIIEGVKFAEAINTIEMYDTLDDMSDSEVFKELDKEGTAIVCKQLVDKDHLNKDIGDEVEIDLKEIKLDVDIIGITDFISGISETWEQTSDITPADSRGDYCIFVSWNTVIPLIDDAFDYLTDADLVIKGDDNDLDYWDLPLINRSYTKNEINKFAEDYGYGDSIQIAERIWDNETRAGLAESSYDYTYLHDNPEDIEDVHVGFENISLNGTTEFKEKRKTTFNNVQDALRDGTDQCVITEDISLALGLSIDDEVSFWYRNATAQNGWARKNLTISAIIEIENTIEAINFNSKNPYVEGNYDVAADDTSAILININTTIAGGGKLLYEDYFNFTDYVYEFWIKLADYFQDHLQIITDLQDYLGSNYIIADMRWLFTQEYAYAPIWIIQVADDYSQDEALERVKEFLLLNNMPAINWRTIDQMRDDYSDQIEFQKGFFNIVLSFALIIAVLGIMINMLISISNRKREIGMMRAIGTYKKELVKMILGETLILVFSGFLIGALMGTFAANQLLLGLPLDAVFDLRLYIDYWAILTLFGVVIVVAILAAALPCLKVLKLDVIEALRAI